DIAQKILAFAVTLGVLITFHELGHYVVARLAGVKVLRFSIGFGRVVWSRRIGRDATEWAISAVPLGGYVKMVDEREGDVAPADRARAFNRQNVWKRIAIVAAGPLANLLLAVLLFAGTYMAGIPGQRAVLASPPAASPAAVAGLSAGDVVRAVDGEPVRSWQDLRWRLLRLSGGERTALSVERPDGTIVTRELPLGSVASADWEGNFMAALGLKIDLGAPRVHEVLPCEPGGDVALCARRGVRGGSGQDVGAVGVHAEDARAHSRRQRIAQEHQRSADNGRFRRAVRAGRCACFRRLPRADQHQPRRAQPAARAFTRWRTLVVLSGRDFQRQSRFRPRPRGRPAHRHGRAGPVDGFGAFQ